MDVLISHAIIQSVRDTAIRFAESEGGQKEWRAILTEIIQGLPTSNTPLMSQFIDGQRVLRDGGDATMQSGDQTRLGIREIDDEGNITEIYQWHLTVEGHVLLSRECAWFIESLRVIGFSHSRGTLRGTREAFEQNGITWGTLVRFLRFVHEKSDWTTPLMPRQVTHNGVPLERHLIRTQCYKDRIRWCHRQILMESGTIDRDELYTGTLIQDSWDPHAAIHELFNQEQNETLEFEGQHPIPRQSVGFVVEDSRTQNKRQLTEILSIIEEKAGQGEIREGDYKDYADLLMGFHNSLSTVD